MLTTQQAAQLAGVARITILKWIERGHLPATKYGRDWLIDERDLDAYRQSPKTLGRPRKSTH
jgi:excisionase family DNA binding protein